jgi:uncharacterized FlaG/YvyC family protein
VNNVPTSIGNRYGSYYTQAADTAQYKTNKNSADNCTEQANSAEEYFQNIRQKYPNINLNMSDLYSFKKDEITYNISPNLLSKASNEPEAAKKLTDLLDQAPETAGFINAFKYMGNNKITSVSFYIDKNGGFSCQVELQPIIPPSQRKKEEEKKMREAKQKKRKEELRALKKALEEKLEEFMQLKKKAGRHCKGMVNIKV